MEWYYTLARRGAIEPLPEETTEPYCIIGEIGKWIEPSPPTGEDVCTAYLIVQNYTPKVLIRRVWCAYSPYCASGCQEEIIPFPAYLEKELLKVEEIKKKIEEAMQST